MNHPLRTGLVAILAIATAVSAVRTQGVVLSEIRADAAERWIELHNRGSAPANLDGWSLFCATRTTGMPQNYWWPFPTGTVIAPDGFVRVFWHQDPSGPVAPGEYYTGTSPYGYLFGLGGEALHGDAGAVALVATQSNALMNTPASYVDWVSYGAHGFQRESFAVQNGVWTAGAEAPAIPTGQSLARDEAQIGAAATTAQQWFVDPTPTPMAPNIAGVLVASYGTACAVPGHHLVGTPLLHVTSLPLLGNAQFGFVVDATTGFYGEVMLLAFSAGPKPAAQPTWLPSFAGSTCREAIDPAAVIGCRIVPTHVAATSVPMSLANLPVAMAGVELHAQALVFDWLPNTYPPFQGISNALLVVLGQ
ncbi:MAG: lamin tail domain-containing protein [Planctomycetota bacterium]